MRCAACCVLLQAAHLADCLLARGRVVPATARWISSGAGPACRFAHIECHLVSPKVPLDFLRESGLGGRQDRGLVPSMGEIFGSASKKEYEKRRHAPSASLRDPLKGGGDGSFR